ncbi:MAG TPA: KpsF/GutQ family sugar-phosphate isomerase [Bacteroidales bacterium]|jgi:arabinose-5-phosphate isomerase|nr:KpsF/GutQ family sugar-phosphate isomerase [Bacteroidales bacterium]HPE40351.1 KpsF/GutQ family sugar-phosphate isomerase [Bacteroidales bacterium]
MKDMIARAKQVLQEEADAIIRLKSLINDDFGKSLEVILNAKGRIIVTGIGKSAIIGQKIVATFNSTGTPAIFMHAAEAIHGDLGIIQPDDVVLCLSKSGNTPEISVLMPFFKMSGNKIIAIVGDPDSFLGKEADFVLDCSIEKEACPNNLAPTCSSTAQLVIGDALASCLIELRGFTSQDFAKYHPGGMLGKRLYTRVRDLYRLNEKPEVHLSSPMPNVILEISGKRLGITAVTDQNRVVGCITDGDLRRMLEKHTDYSTLLARDVMSANPKTLTEDVLAVEALELMKKKNITSIFVVDEQGFYLGVLHLHDIIKEGIY